MTKCEVSMGLWKGHSSPWEELQISGNNNIPYQNTFLHNWILNYDTFINRITVSFNFNILLIIFNIYCTFISILNNYPILKDESRMLSEVYLFSVSP